MWGGDEPGLPCVHDSNEKPRQGLSTADIHRKLSDGLISMQDLKRINQRQK